MNVDFVATDWGTVGPRRAHEEPARPGRLEHVPHLACRRGLRESRRPTSPCAPMATRPGSAGRTSRRSRSRGRRLVRRQTLDEEKAAIGRLNKAAMENVVYAPTGFFLGYQAWRRNVAGIAEGPAAVLLGRLEVTLTRRERSRARCSPTSSDASLATIPVMAFVALFVFSPALYRAGRPGRRHRRRPGDAGRCRAHPRRASASTGPILVRFGEWFWQHRCRATSASRSSPTCRSRS